MPGKGWVAVGGKPADSGIPRMAAIIPLREKKKKKATTTLKTTVDEDSIIMHLRYAGLLRIKYCTLFTSLPFTLLFTFL